MGKHLSDRDIDKVIEMLDGWHEELTWEKLCTACQDVIGTTPVRQTLYRIERIRGAYLTAKKRIREGVEELPIPTSLRVASARIMRLENENMRLKREQAALLNQFVVWQYNAHVKGLTNVDLNRPLPAIDRGKDGD